jgi:hypothetical protein
VAHRLPLFLAPAGASALCLSTVISGTRRCLCTVISGTRRDLCTMSLHLRVPEITVGGVPPDQSNRCRMVPQTHTSAAMRNPGSSAGLPVPLTTDFWSPAPCTHTRHSQRKFYVLATAGAVLSQGLSEELGLLVYNNHYIQLISLLVSLHLHLDNYNVSAVPLLTVNPRFLMTRKFSHNHG